MVMRRPNRVMTQDQAACLFDKALRGQCSPEEADAFRGQMLTEMARMSLDDGLVLSPSRIGA